MITVNKDGIAVLGVGYVGLTTAAGFASLGSKVIGVEKDPHRLDIIANGKVPFYEPELEELVSDVIDSGIFTITDSLIDALKECQFVLICVGTPPLPSGEPDLSQVTEAANEIGTAIGELLKDDPDRDWIICNKSTLPVGSVQWVESLVGESMERSGWSLPEGGSKPYTVASLPEFLREGSAVRDFFAPDRVIIGTEDPEEADRVSALFQPLASKLSAAGKDLNVITMSVTSAEMVKYSSNAYLATRISFVNEIASMCEVFGADVREVVAGMGADSRIGTRYFSPGVGWGGSCLGKDVSALRVAAEQNGYTSELLDATISINRRQRLSVISKLEAALGDLRGKRIGLMGLSFKPGTDDLREAPSLSVIERLVQAGAQVTAYDPVVKDPGKLVPFGVENVIMAPDLERLAEGSHALVLLTEWPEFKEINMATLSELMSGRVLLDGRNFLSEEEVSKAGLQYLGIGF